MIPVWHVLDRETGELVDTVHPASLMHKALMAGDADWLFVTEVAHNTLTGDFLYRSGNTRTLLAQMTRDATADGATGQGFEATR